MKRAVLLVVLAALTPRRVRADDDVIAPMVQMDLEAPGRRVTAEAALITDGDSAGGMLDLRGALAVSPSMSIGVRLPLFAGRLATPDRRDAFGAPIGDIALSLAFVRRIPIDAGGAYRVGVRAVATLPTSAGDADLARTIAQIEFAHTPGEIFNAEASSRLELAVRWDGCEGGYELGGVIGKANYVFGDETFKERFTFWGVSAGGAVRVGNVEILAEAFLVDDDFRKLRSIDLGVRMPRVNDLTVRGFATFIDDDQFFGVGVAGTASL